ncbi:hypothetical protein CCP3SC15_440002 [Gammaproteobacteria bacterium]
MDKLTATPTATPNAAHKGKVKSGTKANAPPWAINRNNAKCGEDRKSIRKGSLDLLDDMGNQGGSIRPMK